MSNNDWPRIWLLFATFKRTEAALQTIESLRQYLKYPNLHWHVCDDGSLETDDGTDRWHAGVLTDAIAKFYPPVTFHEMDTLPGAFNTGGNVNRGIAAAHENGCDIHMLVFDDWALLRGLDIRPMVDVLDRYQEVGFIRLSYTVPHLGAHTIRYDPLRLNQIWMWWRLIRKWSVEPTYKEGTESYLVSTQPYVAHRRFFEFYGYHPEHCSPGEAEIGLGAQYNRVNHEDGPRILFPIGQCTTHAPWGHIAARAHDYAAQFGQA